MKHRWLSIFSVILIVAVSLGADYDRKFGTIQNSPQLPTDVEQYYLDHYSCYEESYIPTCEDWTVMKKLTVNGHDHPSVDFFQIRYKSDGLNIYGLMMKPKAEGKYPTLIFNHGGVGGIPENSLPLNFDVAAKGYVVLMSSYRGEHLILDNTAQIQINTTNPLSEGITDNKEVHDVLNLLECRKVLDFADSSKVGMYGASHGGLLTLLAIERSSEIDVAVHLYGYDLFKGYLKYLDNPTGVSTKIFSPEFQAMTFIEQLNYINTMDPVFPSCIEKIKTPLLVMVGDEDSDEIYEGSLDLMDSLKREDKTFLQKIYPREGHSFNYYILQSQKQGNKLNAFELLAGFLDRFLLD